MHHPFGGSWGLLEGGELTVDAPSERRRSELSTRTSSDFLGDRR